MSPDAAAGLVLAHHPVVEALPVVVPAVVLTGAFGLVVWGDRRRARRARAAGTMEGCSPATPDAPTRATSRSGPRPPSS